MRSENKKNRFHAKTECVHILKQINKNKYFKNFEILKSNNKQ